MAHVAMAEWAREDLRLDKVVFIPNRIPPHKTTFAVTPPGCRLEMLELAIAGNPGFSISAVELDRDGPSYTVDTLRSLRQTTEYAEADLFLIIGADNLVEFAQWRNADEIQKLCVLVVYPRYGVQVDKNRSIYSERAILLKAPVIEIASSEIRRRLTAGHSIRYLVPEAVFEYIERSGVYKKK
jgi:nicotinate-nucleotide adenylyltransferase